MGILMSLDDVETLKLLTEGAIHDAGLIWDYGPLQSLAQSSTGPVPIFEGRLASADRTAFVGPHLSWLAFWTAARHAAADWKREQA